MKFSRRKKEKRKARKCFLKNGSTFLQKLIEDCNGISSPIRMFSSAQISKATNHFDPNCYLSEPGGFNWYKGVIEGRSYTIKEFTYLRYAGETEYYNDIALSSRVSNHSGFLRLVGCCLEFPFLVVVFENTEYGVLNRRGSVGSEDGPLLPWNVRLKIAKEVAIAVTYLHAAFPRTIIHRDLKPMNVFLDKNWKAKLSDFSNSVTLPEGKSWIEDKVVGSYGYSDSVYVGTGVVTEYLDVFSFGVFMLVLLMGRPAMVAGLDGDRVSIVDYVKDLRERGEPVVFGGDANDVRTGQREMFLELALRCCEKRNKDRPKMILVAKEIKLIERSFDC